MIDIKNISISYGAHRVLENFSAHIARNTITAIVGPNGSGKSTLLGAISCDIPINSGEILLHGHPLQELTSEELAYLRSYAQQSHSYWMAYSVAEIVWMGHENVPEARFNYLVEALDIAGILGQSVTTLSGGQLQRVEIARAFMRDTTLVLLDEPFASQDLQSIARIKRLMTDEKKRGVTIVLIAHERREDLTWCDSVIEIEG